MRYVVRFLDGAKEHELRAATFDGAEAIVRFLKAANVEDVWVGFDEGELDAPYIDPSDG